MTLKDEAQDKIRQQQAAAAAAEALRLNPPPIVYEYSVDTATAAEIRELVEEFQRRRIRSLPMITIEISSAWGKYGWNRRDEDQTIYTATHVNKRGWMLTYNGKALDMAVTEEGGLVSASPPVAYQDGMKRYAVAVSSKMGMHNGHERRARIYRGFGRAATTYISIGVGNSVLRPADFSVEVNRYSYNGDDSTSYYQTLHEVLVGTLATLMS
jgi:hypothetical protein